MTNKIKATSIASGFFKILLDLHLGDGGTL